MTWSCARLQVVTAKRRTRIPRSPSVTFAPDAALSVNAPADKDGQIWRNTCQHMQPPAWQLPSAPLNTGPCPAEDSHETQHNYSEPLDHGAGQMERQEAERKLAAEIGEPGDRLSRGHLASDTWTGSALCPLQGKVARTSNAATSPATTFKPSPNECHEVCLC